MQKRRPTRARSPQRARAAPQKAVSSRQSGPGRSPSRSEASDDHLALSVWVRLLKAHGLLLREVRRLVPEGLTLPQFDVLVQINRHEDGTSPGALTRELLVTAGNVTGIVERLVRLGLVDRRPVPEDRRTIRLSLTPRGRQLMQRAIPRHRRDVGALLKVIPDEDLVRLRDQLGVVIHTFEPPA
jgi:DNA-binding MarR family transcriptional regulator